MKINPRETEVIGYDRDPTCLELLISLMVGMIERDSIPHVKLYTFDNGQTYQIPYPGVENLSGADAGHHRTLAAVLLGEDLEIEVVESIDGTNNKIETPITARISINQVRIKSDPATFHFEKDIVGKNYRGLPGVDDFINLYGKINLALKYGTHTDYSLQRSSYEHILRQLETIRTL